MLALETIPGVRIAGTRAVLDTAVLGDGMIALRLAPDEVFAFGRPSLELIDGNPDLIVVTETGFTGCWLTADELRARVLPHVDWELPSARPALAQGLVAGVPAKLWLEAGRALLLCAAAYARELAERIG